MFDFSQISHKTPEALIDGLHSALNTSAKKYNIVLKEHRLTEKFAELIETLGQLKGPVVIIIDEYDKPLVSLVDNLEQAASLVGYTDQEVDRYLTDHIQTFADARKEDYEQTRLLQDQIQNLLHYWEAYNILKAKKIVLTGITFNKTEQGIAVLCKTKEL